jgi:hypothetical protein
MKIEKSRFLSFKFLGFTLMSAEGSRYNQRGHIEPLASTAPDLAALALAKRDVV